LTFAFNFYGVVCVGDVMPVYTVPKIRFLYSQKDTARPRSQFLHSYICERFTVYIPRIGLPTWRQQNRQTDLGRHLSKPDIHIGILLALYLQWRYWYSYVLMKLLLLLLWMLCCQA